MNTFNFVFISLYLYIILSALFPLKLNAFLFESNPSSSITEHSTNKLTLKANSNSVSNDSNSNLLKVFLLPHSHDDVGWTHTISQYYTNEMKFIFSSIVDTLITDPSKRFIGVEQAFMQRWWEDSTVSDERKSQWLKLLEKGQIEMVLGGWVMHDEACTHYGDQIDQMTLGHRFINKITKNTLRPTKGWHIDPFGSSAITPMLFKRMGFDAHVTNRIDFRVKEVLQEQHSLEFLWSGGEYHDNKKKEKEKKLFSMYTHIMDFYGYCSPDDPRNLYYWDDTGYWGPQGEPALTPEKANEFAVNLTNIALQRAKGYPMASSLLFPWGCDFEFTNAYQMYNSMDLVVKNIKEHPERGIELQYSTLSEYFDSIFLDYKEKKGDNNIVHDNINGENINSFAQMDNERKKIVNADIKNISGDFFPYADGKDSYWSGFYTSRPYQKGFARKASSELRIAEQLLLASELNNNRNDGSKANNNTNADYEDFKVKKTDKYRAVVSLRRAVADIQHHDGITGTALDFVNVMYQRDLRTGLVNASYSNFHSIENLIIKSGPSYSSQNENVHANVDMREHLHHSNNPYKHENPIDITDLSYISLEALQKAPIGSFIPLIVYNSLGYKRNTFVNITLLLDKNMDMDIVVMNGKNEIIQSQLIPPLPYPFCSRNKKNNNNGGVFGVCSYRLYFFSALPPMGFATYFIKKTASTATSLSKVRTSKDVNIDNNEIFVLGNHVLDITFNQPLDQPMNIISVQNKLSLVKSVFDDHIMLYRSQYHTNNGTTSNAYVFRPISKAESLPEIPLNCSQLFPLWVTIEGPFVSEVFTVFALPKDICNAQNQYDGKDKKHYFDYQQESEWEDVQWKSYRIFSTDEILWNNNNNDNKINDQSLLSIWEESKIEIDQKIGPIPKNTETVHRIQSDLQTDYMFETDVNSFFSAKRQFRSNISNDEGLTVAANYFPSSSFGAIEDVNQSNEGRRMFVLLLDRARGVSSPTLGGLESMSHRNIYQTNENGQFAPGTIPLNDTSSLELREWLLFDTVENCVDMRVVMQHQIQQPPKLFFSGNSLKTWSSISSYEDELLTNGSLFQDSFELPLNVHILSTRTTEHFITQLNDNNNVKVEFIWRFVHLFGPNESPRFSKSVSLDLTTILNSPFRSVQQTGITTVGPPSTSNLNGTMLSMEPLDIITLITQY